MSKIRNYQENNTFNKTNISAAPRTPRRLKPKVDSSQELNSLNQSPVESKKKTIINNMKNNLKTKNKESSEASQDTSIKATPKEILSSLLHNILGKSLLNIEARTK